MQKPLDLEELRVLVVDDEVFMRKMISRILGTIGINHISEATDGGDGLSKLGTENPDVVLLDIMMEPMNGLKFLKALRIGMSPVHRNLPVIVLTGSADQAVFGTAMALDCNAFIQKTKNLEDVRDRIARVLSRPMEFQNSTIYQSVPIPELGTAVPQEARPSQSQPAPENAKEIAIEDVAPGMIVARDLETSEGNILLPTGTVFDAPNLSRLCDISEIIDIPTIWVED